MKRVDVWGLKVYSIKLGCSMLMWTSGKKIREDVVKVLMGFLMFYFLCFSFVVYKNNLCVVFFSQQYIIKLS